MNRTNTIRYVVMVDSVRERVYRELRSRIMTLELIPGTAISTQEIADELSVSRTPVREAFLKLQEEHLLEISPQKPSVVARIDRKRVGQEQFVREALEVENMRLFAVNPSPETIENMRRSIAEQKEAFENRDYELYQELDDEFHLMPFRDTGQQFAVDVISQMNGHYGRVRMMIRKNHEVSNDIIGEHEELLESIVKKDAVEAVRRLRSHIQAIQPIQDMLFQQYSDYFV